MNLQEYTNAVLRKVCHPDCMDVFTDERILACYLKNMSVDDCIDYIIDAYYVGK